MAQITEVQSRPKVSTLTAEAVLPKSVTRSWIVWLAFGTWLVTLLLVRRYKMDVVLATLICVGALAAINYLCDVVFLKVHKSESSGLDWSSWNPSVQRALIKYFGLLASIGIVLLIYWLFPEYESDFFGAHRNNPAFYGDYRVLLWKIFPWWLGLAVPYIFIVDAVQKEKLDGYYSAGSLVTLRFEKVDWSELWQHCLSWLVKGFFLALMFSYYARDMRNWMSYDLTPLKDFHSFFSVRGFMPVFDFGYYFIFLADVTLAVTGYLLSLRIFGTHVRRVEPTFMGWVVALVCYQPFWSQISSQYLNYTNDYPWGVWLQNRPAWYVIWGLAILVLYGIYLWATIMFGTRFSNLTHRGILTNGPYRWTKHPAYIAKNSAYWLSFIPFVVHQGWGDSIRRCIMLGLLNYVYYLRAKTEEANLSTDPTYVQYSEWMREHGIFRWLRFGRAK